MLGTKVKSLFFGLLFLSAIFVGFSYVTNDAYAGCTVPAYCDAAPGTCLGPNPPATCNGGQSCQIGGWYWYQNAAGVWIYGCSEVTWTSCCTGGGTTTNCTCSSTGGSCSGSGSACGGSLYPGTCNCNTTGGGGGPIDNPPPPDPPDPPTCYPNCSAPYCGQSDGCGGFCGTTDIQTGCGVAPNRCGGVSVCGAACSNADNGVPASVTITAPLNGQNVAPSGGVVPITWVNNSTLTDVYEVEVYNAYNPSCASAGAYCNTNYGATSLNYPVANGVYIYTARVRAKNLSCGSQPSAWTTVTFGIADNITGNFRLDPTQTAVLSGNVCVGGGSATNLGAGAGLTSVGIDGATRNATIAGSSYSLYTYYWNPGNNTMTLNPGTAPNGEPYICSCPTGCVYSGINSPQANVNFYIAQNDLVNQGWWQVLGGNVYAGQLGGVALRSYIPTFYCNSGAGCTPYILAKNTAGQPDTSGVAVTGGGAADSTKDAGNSTANITDRGTQTLATGSVTTKIRESYDYFYREFSLGLSPTDDFASTAGDARKPTSAPSGGKAAYYHNGDLTIQNQWTVNADEKIVVFVNGNLTITDPTSVGQLITVAPGGFLSFIVKGNTTITPSVGNSILTSLNTNLEGVFISDGTLTLQGAGASAGGDKRLVLAGTYVGWTNVVIQRDFDNGGQRKAENNTKPASTVIFRPDFLVNVPEQMTRSSYIWQETN